MDMGLEVELEAGEVAGCPKAVSVTCDEPMADDGAALKMIPRREK
jgi:hypothetical protein